MRERDGPPTRAVLVKGRAGLGNRLLGVLTGILYAQITGRALFVDWSDRTYSPAPEQNVFHTYFDCRRCRADDALPATDSVEPAIWRGRLRESVWDIEQTVGAVPSRRRLWRMSTIDVMRPDPGAELVVLWTFFDRVRALRSRFPGVLDRFVGMTNHEILGTLLREELPLQPPLQQRVSELRDAWIEESTLGVHVRHTDRQGRLSATLRAVDEVVRGDRRRRILLATDDIAVRDLFVRRYRDVVSAPRWHGPPGRPLHGRDGHPDPAEGGIDALVDLFLLGSCRSIVADTSSTFAYVASVLCRSGGGTARDMRPLRGRALGVLERHPRAAFADRVRRSP